MTNEEIVNKNRNKYIGIEKLNNQGLKIKIIDYTNTRNIVVQFEDGSIQNTSLNLFKKGSVKKHEERVGAKNISKDGIIMKVIYYKSYSDIVVEFDDKWHYQVHTTWSHFINGDVKNPYCVNKYGGILGVLDGLSPQSKEVRSWYNILLRTRDDNFKNKHKTYIDCTICEEWLFFKNYYNWLISQSNYNQWKNGKQWAVDKDILIKHNKTYSPSTCCLVPKDINNMFLRSEKTRGKYPIGVTRRKNDGMFESQCMNPFLNKYVTIGLYIDEEQAFKSYKRYKEDLIKKMANIEYKNKNITYNCYVSMINYEVDIND